MSLNQEVEALRKIPLFQNIEPSKLKLLAFTSDRIEFTAGQELFHEGDMGDAAYIVMDGSAEVFIDTAGGRLTVAKVGNNDFVGEIAILCDVPRTATVAATSRLVTLRISKDLFFRLVAEFPQMAVEIMRVLAHRVEATTKDLRDAKAERDALAAKLAAQNGD